MLTTEYAEIYFMSFYFSGTSPVFRLLYSNTSDYQVVNAFYK